MGRDHPQTASAETSICPLAGRYRLLVTRTWFLVRPHSSSPLRAALPRDTRSEKPKPGLALLPPNYFFVSFTSLPTYADRRLAPTSARILLPPSAVHSRRFRAARAAALVTAEHQMPVSDRLQTLAVHPHTQSRSGGHANRRSLFQLETRLRHVPLVVATRRRYVPWQGEVGQ